MNPVSAINFIKPNYYIAKRQKISFMGNIIDTSLKKDVFVRNLNPSEFNKEIPKNLTFIICPVPQSKEETENIMQSFFNNDPETEEIIKNMDIEQYGKKGLPLKYSREEFIKDLSKFDKDTIRKLSIEPIYENSKLIGYDGIIDLSDKSSMAHNIANDFINNNEIQTYDPETDEILNFLIKGMKEFINVIGKLQSHGHEYSLDIHTLKVLKEALNDEEYQKLSDYDKTCLKFVIILHDIAKHQNITDKIHPELSSIYAQSILEKYPLSDNIKQRVCKLIKNHHWLENYDKKIIDLNTVAEMFKDSNDFELAQIMTRADIKGVGIVWWERFKNTISQESINEIREAIDKINSKDYTDIFLN